MNYDYSSLEERITEKFGSREGFAKAMNLTVEALKSKLHSRSWWTQTEIERARILLGLSLADVEPYFFARKFNEVE